MASALTSVYFIVGRRQLSLGQLPVSYDFVSSKKMAPSVLNLSLILQLVILVLVDKPLTKVDLTWNVWLKMDHSFLVLKLSTLHVFRMMFHSYV